MGLNQYLSIVLLLIAVSALLLASPIIQKYVVYPQPDNLTEMSLRGPFHNATYPSNVTSGYARIFYVELTNRLGCQANYSIAVKFRNQTQSDADSFNHTSSELQPLLQIPLSVADQQTAELPITVKFHYQPLAGSSKIQFTDIEVNGHKSDASYVSASWDSERKGFFGNLLFELWLYNSTVGSLQYNQRYLSLWFKLET
jgi:hypothetical protein